MLMNPTLYTDINSLLDQLLTELQVILGKKLVGFYLYGSLVTGDFDHECSDIDLLAALSSDINEEEFNTLQQMHRSFAQRHKEWDDRIEVAYLTVAALKTYRLRMSRIAIISPGEPFHIKEAGRDWLMNWYVVREKGITLYGPVPTMLIDPIEKEEVLQVIQEYAQAWRERIKHTRLRKAQAYAILTMCRALYTLKRGEIVSKKQAAVWAEKELPAWSSLIQRALFWREAWRDEHVDHDATLSKTQQFVEFVLNQCRL